MEDIFESQSYYKVAMAKIKPDNPDFRIFCCGWVGDYHTTDTMQVTGAVFREAKSGPRKGKKVVEVTGTRRSAFVTVAEMKEQETLEGK